MSKAEGRKYDGGKPMMSLVPPYALEEMAKVLTMGAKKYAVDNWKYVEDGKQRYLDAMLRHINAYIKGETNDPEFGTHHLAHAACCLYFILDADVSGVPLEPKAQKTRGSEVQLLQEEKLKGTFYVDVGPQNPNVVAYMDGILKEGPLDVSKEWNKVSYPVPISPNLSAAQQPDYTQITSYNIDFPPKSV